ncbi:MAG: NAD(P)/FAD-dependent oxidoreductase, partial [Aquificota bacterium]
MHDYDVVILGGGLAYAGAELLRNKGLKVAIVEKEEPHLGGVCLHEGCVPTKLYLAHAQKGKRVNLADLKKKKEDITSRLREDIKRLLKGVDFVYGYGELVEPHTVLVEGKKLSAKYVIINTGKSYTKSPNGKDLLELEELPKSLNLVGDDPTALEFACMFALFGSSVNLYFDQQSLDFVHPSIKGRLLKMLKDIGINLYKPEDFKQGSAYFLNKRAPNSTCVRLELARDKVGHLLVDRNYETTLPNH